MKCTGMMRKSNKLYAAGLFEVGGIFLFPHTAQFFQTTQFFHISIKFPPSSPAKLSAKQQRAK